jgi:hypothetical protein
VPETLKTHVVRLGSPEGAGANPAPLPRSANLVNAYYERPAMLALAGDVAGRRILDAGCGSGPLLAALRDGGASVTGFDKSAGDQRACPRLAAHHDDVDRPGSDARPFRRAGKHLNPSCEQWVSHVNDCRRGSLARDETLPPPGHADVHPPGQAPQ